MHDIWGLRELFLNCDGKNELWKIIVWRGSQFEPVPKEFVLTGDLDGGEWYL